MVATAARTLTEQELETVSTNGVDDDIDIVSQEEIEGAGLTVARVKDSEAARRWLEELDSAKNWLDETNPLPVKGIFDDAVKLFTAYRVSIQFSHKVLGGIPKNPDIIRGWLKAKAGLKDGDELKRMVAKTLQQMGLDMVDSPTLEQIDEAFAKVKDVRNGNGFKHTKEAGRYIEGRQVKAMLRESCNTLYAGKRFKKSGADGKEASVQKGPKNFLAEHVFVVQDRMWFGKQDPDGFEFIVGHITGPQGAQSTLGEYEFMMQPTLTFHVISDDDDVITEEVWARILTKSQQLGLGASRSMGFGRFSITEFKRLPKGKASELIVPTLELGDLSEYELSLI